MKQLIIISFSAGALLLSACKKDAYHDTDTASLTIINASVNSGAVKISMNGGGSVNYFSGITSAISYGTSVSTGLIAEKSIPYSIVSGTDTTKTIVADIINVPSRSINTLILCGQATAVDTIQLREHIPVVQDSSFGVRFINLSFNSSPISVNIQGQTSGSEAAALSYKQASAFTTHSAGYRNQTYVFEVRDASSQSLLGTYSFQTASPANPVPAFRNCTLAWIGQTGSTGATATKIIRINNY